MHLSTRILNMQESPIRKLAYFAEEAKSKGIKVYHLNIGQPDVKTPDEFFEAVKTFNEPVLKYTASQGIDMLIQSFIKYYSEWDIDFEKDEIMITNGGSEAILFALLAVCDVGDNVIIPEPFYTNYNGFAEVAGVNVKPFLTYAENGFHLPDRSEIEKLIDNKTRAILLSNPGNPTGVVYTEEEIRMVAEIAKANNLYIIADEVYREFVYDNLKYTSFMHVKDVLDRVILIDSISKRYSACGARIGLIASKNKVLIKNVLKLCQSRLCVPTIEQIGAANLINTDKNYFVEVKEEYQRRRDVVYEGLSQIEGVICQKPKGAFYVIAKLPIEDAEHFSKWLLTDFNLNGETVMVAPAEGFYATNGLGKNEIRISYCINCDDLQKAMNIIKEAIKAYRGL
ncbi:MAG: pyridoxal phosphate-dependent aminotransferase [Caloramator sp.]|nr:pyridoxal phosphate-dependent aminotransferase [Caloramator sp.]